MAASMENDRPVLPVAMVGFGKAGGSMRRKGDREPRFLVRMPIRLCFGERPAGAEVVALVRVEV